MKFKNCTMEEGHKAMHVCRGHRCTSADEGYVVILKRGRMRYSHIVLEYYTARNLDKTRQRESSEADWRGVSHEG